MRRRRVVAAAAGGGLLLAGLAAFVTVGASRDAARVAGGEPRPASAGVANSHGRGESLILVVGGIYPTKDQAVAAVAASNRGELQGFYLASSNDFRLTGRYAVASPSGGQPRLVWRAAAPGAGRGLPGDRWMALSAFRTRAGAQQFLGWAQSALPGTVARTVQAVRTAGSTPIGLGQEADPDGSGPLLGPVPQQAQAQR